MEPKKAVKTTSFSPHRIDNVVNIKGLKKQNAPYIIMWIFYYGWFVSFATWWNVSPLTVNIFTAETTGLLHILILICSAAFIFIVGKEWFVKAIGVGVISVIISVGLFFTLANQQNQIFLIILMGMAFGILNIGILIPFVFILSNTEKLYAALGGNLFISIIYVFMEVKIKVYSIPYSNLKLSLVLLAIAFSSFLFFDKKKAPEKVETDTIDCPIFYSRIYLTLCFNGFFVLLCRGAGKGMLNILAAKSDYQVILWYYIGSLLGCFICFSVHILSERSFIWLGNITFSTFIVGLFCNAFTMQIPILAVGFAISLGIVGSVGMINLYYIMGVVSKKYSSMRYLKLSVLVIGIGGGVFGVLLGKFIQSDSSTEISIIISILSVIIMLLFMMLATVVSQDRYFDDWPKDSQKPEIDNQQLYIFKKYGLSKREIEVCKLLLQGYTMRQISGILNIAYPTVNTYCTSSYRKLNINSKDELRTIFKDYSTK